MQSVFDYFRSIIFDRLFAIVAVIAAVCGALLYELKGPEEVWRAFLSNEGVFLLVASLVPAALMLSALIEVLLSRELVEKWLGVGSGFKGIMLATFAGAFVPGGPFLCFPIVLALYRAGADWAPLITFVSSWSILSAMRIIVFEVPFVGFELPIVRVLSCIWLPPVIGLTARYIARIWPPPLGERDR